MKIDSQDPPDERGFVSTSLRREAPPDACQGGCNRRRRRGRSLSNAEIQRREAFLSGSSYPPPRGIHSFKPAH